MTQQLGEVLLKVVNAGLNRCGAHRFHVLDAVDHQLASAVVIQSTALRVVKRFALGVLVERLLFHVGHQTVQFFTQEGHQALFDIARQAHGRKVR